MRAPGLDRDGFIRREGDLALVPSAFATVVAAAKAAILDSFGPDRLHSGYLYGSIPRGTAVPGVSDLDMLLALRHEPTDTDRKAVTTLESLLDTSFTQINGAGIGLASTAALLTLLEPLTGTILAAILLGERLSATGIAGAAIIATAVILTVQANRGRPEGVRAITADHADRVSSLGSGGPV